MRREVSTDRRYGAPILRVKIKKKKIAIVIVNDETKKKRKEKRKIRIERVGRKKKTRTGRCVVQRSIDSDQSYRVYRGF